MPQDITLVTGIINERLKGGQKCGGLDNISLVHRRNSSTRDTRDWVCWGGTNTADISKEPHFWWGFLLLRLI